MPGLPGLRIFGAAGADTAGLGGEHGHQVPGRLRQGHQGWSWSRCRQPWAGPSARRPASGTAGRSCCEHTRHPDGPARGHPGAACATSPGAAGIQVARAHPPMLRHTFVTTMPGAGLRDVRIAARHAGRAPRCATTGPAATWTATRTASWPPAWPPAPDRPAFPAARAPRETLGIAAWRASRHPAQGVALACGFILAVIRAGVLDPGRAPGGRAARRDAWVQQLPPAVIRSPAARRVVCMATVSSSRVA